MLGTVLHFLEQRSKYLHLWKEKSSLVQSMLKGLLRKKIYDYLMKNDGMNMTTIDKIPVICRALTNM